MSLIKLIIGAEMAHVTHRRLEAIAKVTQRWRGKTLRSRIWKQAEDFDELDALKEKLNSSVNRFMVRADLKLLC